MSDRPQGPTVPEGALHTWLSTRGNARIEAARVAANALLYDYPYSGERLSRIDLGRLAVALRIKLQRRASVSGEARLIPTDRGFVILYSRPRGSGHRYRTSIAHEIAHTLFYSRGHPPRRIIPWSQAEEHFCFDTARMILAPQWLLSSLGIFEMEDVMAALDALVRSVGVSWPVASRLLLVDHAHFVGVSARWTCEIDSGLWRLVRSSAVATDRLTRTERQHLHGLARRWLQSREPEPQVAGRVSPSGSMAFVAVTVPNQKLEHRNLRSTLEAVDVQLSFADSGGIDRGPATSYGGPETNQLAPGSASPTIHRFASTNGQSRELESIR